MVFSTTWLEFKDMTQDPLVRREPVSASCNRRPREGLETHKYSLYPKEHPANWGCISHDCKLDLVTIQGNLSGDKYIRDVLQPVKEHPVNCPLRWRISNSLRVYLSWLQAGFNHHTRQPNWWSVHQRRFATSCCPPFRQPPTSYKACVYGWQRQASSFKSSNRLPPKRSRDFRSLASHEPWFESHIAYLGHVRPLYTDSGASCAKLSSVGSSIASGMAAAITRHPTSNWRDETQGWGRHPSTWGLHPVLHFEQ